MQIVHAELLLVGGLLLCVPAEPDVASFGRQHAAIFASLSSVCKSDTALIGSDGFTLLVNALSLVDFHIALFHYFVHSVS